MNKDTSINLVQYLSLGLVFSYFILNNIILVLIGIILSLLLLNENLTRLIIKIYKNKLMKNIKIEKFDQVEIIDQDSNSKNKDSKLNLVDTIEELGFIPSIDSNDDDTKVA